MVEIFFQLMINSVVNKKNINTNSLSLMVNSVGKSKKTGIKCGNRKKNKE